MCVGDGEGGCTELVMGGGTTAEYQRARNLKMMADARRHQDGEGTGTIAAENLAANHHVLASSEGLECGVSWSHKLLIVKGGMEWH